MVEEGADIIDVGGESTRPFSTRASLEEELARVIPAVRDIRSRSDVMISVDTYKAKVAEEAYYAGADMVNDISALMFDPSMAGTASRLGMYVVLMHIRGTPENMQIDPHYEDVVAEVRDFLSERTAFAVSRGIEEDRIVLDPGIGFGKRVEDNLRLLKGLRTLKGQGRPLLVGTSMKTFIGKVTDSPVEERLEGSLAGVAISVMNGADIVRVHHVGQTRKVVQLVDAVMKS
jgi:dihydropteroate synthase